MKGYLQVHAVIITYYSQKSVRYWHCHLLVLTYHIQGLINPPKSPVASSSTNIWAFEGLPSRPHGCGFAVSYWFLRLMRKCTRKEQQRPELGGSRLLWQRGWGIKFCSATVCLASINQCAKKIRNIYLPELKRICLLGRYILDVRVVFIINSLVFSSVGGVVCDHHIAKVILQRKRTKAESCALLMACRWHWVSTLVSPIYSSWIPVEYSRIHWNPLEYIYVWIFSFLSTIFWVHSRSFQVVPGHSKSFQLILVQFSLK